jgi:deazaflavin-dependent oxidoreductase (nitroreductase family)
VAAYPTLLRRLGHYRWFARAGRAVVPIDQALQRLSRGRVGALGPSVLPELLLTTTGRTSGLPRQVALLFAVQGDALVVVASNWGQPHHPAWSANLLAEPRAQVQVGGHSRPVLARLAAPEEKDRLWPLVLQVWPAYEDYAERSGRDLRVFVLEPSAIC